MPQTTHEARSRAHTPGARLRRSDLRGELRGPGGGARAGRLGSAGADRRPLRDRRAPDLGLRGAHRVARRHGDRAVDQADLPRAGHPHPHVTTRMQLPWTFSTFDYPALCELLFEQCDAEFETAKVDGPDRHAPIHTDRGDLDAPLVVDCLGWRRVLGSSGYQPPDAPLSRGLEVHPGRSGRRPRDLDRSRLRPGRLRLELSGPRRGPGRASAPSIPASTSRSRPSGWREDLERDAVRYQGNWIPHKLRDAAEDEIFFVGDSAGHCLPLTAEGIRTAFYFGIACGRELRAVVDGEKHRDEALRDYAAFSAAHRWKFEWLLRVQRADSPRAAAAARAGAARDGQRPLRALGVRPLSADRAARVRRDPATGLGPPRRADRRLTTAQAQRSQRPS